MWATARAVFQRTHAVVKLRPVTLVGDACQAVSLAVSPLAGQGASLGIALSDSCMITSVGTDKFSATVDAVLLAQVRTYAGPRGLSAFVAVALRHELDRVRLRELLDELTEQLGPPDEGMVAEAVGELTALAHRARTADLPEQRAAAL